MSWKRQKFAVKWLLLPPTRRAYNSGLGPRGICASVAAVLRKVWGLALGSVEMPFMKKYLSSSCSKSAGPMRGPCSNTSTLNPACDNSRAHDSAGGARSNHHEIDHL